MSDSAPAIPTPEPSSPAPQSGYSTVSSEDGFKVTSNSGTAEEIAESIRPDGAPTEDEKVSEAAKKLGEKGGKAAAEAKEAKAEEEAKAKATEDRKKGNPRHDPKARVEEATREAKAAREALQAKDQELQKERQERERYARELEEARRPKPTAQPEPPPVEKPAPPKPGKPQAEDFDDYEAYLDAREAFNRRQWTEEQERSHATKAREHSIGQRAQTLFKQLDEAQIRDRVAPLMGVLVPTFSLTEGQQPTAANFVADYIFNSEQAPALMLHLMEHPQEYQRIASQRSYQAAVIEIAKLEGQISAGSKAVTTGSQPRAEVSKAKPPVRPVTGSPHVADQPPDAEASFEEHRKYWNAREKRA